MKFRSPWKKQPRIQFTVVGKPPRKSSWGEDTDSILKLRIEALKARNMAELSSCFTGPVKLTLTMFAPNVMNIKYKQTGDEDPRKYVGDLDSFVAGVCEALQPAPTNFDRKISKIFEGHEDVGPEVALIVKNDCQVTKIIASKIQNKKMYYVVKIDYDKKDHDE